MVREQRYLNTCWTIYRNRSDKQGFFNNVANYIAEQCKESNVVYSEEDLESVVDRIFDVLDRASNPRKWNDVFGNENSSRGDQPPKFNDRSNYLQGDNDAEKEENLSKLTTIRPSINLGTVSILVDDWTGRPAYGPEIGLSLDVKNFSLSISVKDNIAQNGRVKTKLVYYYLSPKKFARYFDLAKAKSYDATAEGLINAVISTRVDPFHIMARESHGNGNFGYISDDIRRKLFQYYYQQNASTPHAHFATRSQMVRKGNNYSHAINFGQIAVYLRDCIDAYKMKKEGKGSAMSNNGICTCDRLLTEDLDMPFLGLFKDGAEFDDKKFMQVLVSNVIEPIRMKKKENRTEEDLKIIDLVNDTFE